MSFILGVTNKPFMLCCYAECYYTECLDAEQNKHFERKMIEGDRNSVRHYIIIKLQKYLVIIYNGMFLELATLKIIKLAYKISISLQCYPQST